MYYDETAGTLDIVGVEWKNAGDAMQRFLHSLARRFPNARGEVRAEGEHADDRWFVRVADGRIEVGSYVAIEVGPFPWTPDEPGTQRRMPQVYVGVYMLCGNLEEVEVFLNEGDAVVWCREINQRESYVTDEHGLIADPAEREVAGRFATYYVAPLRGGTWQK